VLVIRKPDSLGLSSSISLYGLRPIDLERAEASQQASILGLILVARPDVHTRLKPMNTPNNRHVHHVFTLCKTHTCVPVQAALLFHARYLLLRREARSQ